MTVLRNIARMAGAAVDRHRHRDVRRAQVEAVIEDAHVVERGDRHPGRADLAVDVRPPVVEGHRVERGRQPGGVAAA
jgi:hypothetical protein